MFLQVSFPPRRLSYQTFAPFVRTIIADTLQKVDDKYSSSNVFLTYSCVSPFSFSHPRRPRGSQSGREKSRDESSQAQAEKPLGTDSHRTISKRSSECWLAGWLGTKKMLCIIVPNRRTASPEFFSWIRTRVLISPQLPGSFTKLS